MEPNTVHNQPLGWGFRCLPGMLATVHVEGGNMALASHKTCITSSLWLPLMADGYQQAPATLSHRFTIVLTYASSLHCLGGCN